MAELRLAVRRRRPGRDQRAHARRPSRRSRAPRPPARVGSSESSAAIQGAQVSRSAGVGLFSGGAQRTVATIRASTSRWPSPACSLVAWRRPPGAVQAGEEPVGARVAGEDPAGAVAAVGRRRQADDRAATARGRPSRRSACPSRAGRRTTPASPGRRPRATPPAAGTPSRRSPGRRARRARRRPRDVVRRRRRARRACRARRGRPATPSPGGTGLTNASPMTGWGRPALGSSGGHRAMAAAMPCEDVGLGDEVLRTGTRARIRLQISAPAPITSARPGCM